MTRIMINMNNMAHLKMCILTIGNKCTLFIPIICCVLHYVITFPPADQVCAYEYARLDIHIHINQYSKLLRRTFLIEKYEKKTNSKLYQATRTSYFWVKDVFINRNYFRWGGICEYVFLPVVFSGGIYTWRISRVVNFGWNLQFSGGIYIRPSVKMVVPYREMGIGIWSGKTFRD